MPYAARSFGILSSFPPTPCGIATFSAALAAGLVANESTVDVVRCGDAPALEDPVVLASVGDVQAAVETLNRTDVAIIQHEYGIYAGTDGSDVLGVLRDLTVPIIVVAHTVVETPTRGQRAVLDEVCDNADITVVMTESARTRLIEHYDVRSSTIRVIPHGAATPPSDPSATARHANRSPRLLTWGLLGPGKGIEWAIDAVAMLRDLAPRPNYVIAGATHPKVVAHAGESYRELLVERARIAGVSDFVSFDAAYRDLASLTELIVSADLVVLPYDSKDQVTSGVLVDAVAAGRPVVSTAFPHAVELLASGAGIVVPQRDPEALASAIRAVLTDASLATSMAAEARRLAPELSWNAVAGRYCVLADDLLAVRA